MSTVIQVLVTRIGVPLVAAALLASLAGCSPGEASTPANPDCLTGASLALIVPVHQGAQAPGIPADWDCALDAAIRGGVPISVISAEGRPQVLLPGFVTDVNTANPLVANDQVTAAKNTIIGVVAAAAATSDGNDLLAAVALAAELAPGGQIMTLDNGATDTGVVRTVEDGMTTLIDPTDVAQLVVDSGACPAVEGSHILMYGLGYQVAPAEPISQRQRDLVGLTWQVTLEECGAQVDVVALPRTGDGPQTQHVTRPIIPEAEPAPPPPANAGQCEAVLPDAVIGFVADEATFYDEAHATAIIAAAADRIRDCAGRVEVIGTTSSHGTPEGRTQVSTMRANVVRQQLAKHLGIPESSIDARGLGFDQGDGACVEDRVNGILDPVLAAQNRKVIIRVVP